MKTLYAMRFATFLFILFFLSSCKQPIPTEKELIEEVKGIWEVTEISTYLDGVETKMPAQNIYWNFNEYNDLIIHDRKEMLLVTPYTFLLVNEQNDSGKIINRKINAMSLSLPFKKGTFKINNYNCMGAEVVKTVISMEEFTPDLEKERKPKLPILDKNGNQIRRDDPLGILTESDIENSLDTKFQNSFSVNQSSKDLIIECDCIFLKNSPNYSGENPTKVSIKLKRAEDQSLTNKLFAQSKNDLRNTTSINSSKNENLYRNDTHNFRIRYPDTWESIAGDSKLTVAKFARRDSGKAISILVEEVSRPMEKISVANERIAFEKGLKARNIDYKNLSIEEGFLNNYPALVVEYDQKVKTLEFSIDYVQKQIMCYHGGFIYTVSISMPKDLYDINERNRFNKVVGSFVFEE